MSQPVTTEQRTLDMLQVGVQQVIAHELLSDAQFVGQTAEMSWAADYMGRHFCAQLRAFVLAEHVQDDQRTLKFDSPASWWQFFKLTYATTLFPKWFLRRHPVRYRTTEKKINLKVYHTYPDARFALPPEQFGQPFVFTVITPAWGADAE